MREGREERDIFWLYNIFSCSNGFGGIFFYSNCSARSFTKHSKIADDLHLASPDAMVFRAWLIVSLYHIVVKICTNKSAIVPPPPPIVIVIVSTRNNLECVIHAKFSVSCMHTYANLSLTVSRLIPELIVMASFIRLSTSEKCF